MSSQEIERKNWNAETDKRGDHVHVTAQIRAMHDPAEGQLGERCPQKQGTGWQGSFHPASEGAQGC